MLCLAVPAALGGTTSGYAVTYLTVEQAQAALCPGARLQPVPIRLSPKQRQAIGKASGVRVRQTEFTAWRTAAGGWFLVDQVIGKH